MTKWRNPLTELFFPVGGLNRRGAVSMQPPSTTPYCLNVRPYDPLSGTNGTVATGSAGYQRLRGGSRPGMSKVFGSTDMGTSIQHLGYAAYVNAGNVSNNILLAISQGKLYQNASGTMTAVTGGPQFNSSVATLRGTQVGQLYYIADYRSTSVSGTNGTIASTNRLSDPSIADWTALGITASDYVWVSPNNDLEENIFPILSVTATYIVIQGTITNQSGGAIWQIGRIPKVFDPSAPTAALTGLGGTLPIPATHYQTGSITSVLGVVNLSGGTFPTFTAKQLINGVTLKIPNASGIGTSSYLVASQQSTSQITLTDTTTDANCTNSSYVLEWTGTYYGVPPLGCTLCCTYRGRLVLAGPGSIWYMSRVLQPTDWDYGYDPNDASRAVGGTATSTGGIPEPIVALMPHSDDYLIFGCERSLWVLTGDAAYGGTITALSRDIGVIGPTAWCNLPDSTILFLSRDGLYQIPAGANAYPIPISRPTLPDELLNVDSTNNIISMSYDVVARGVHLSITPTSGAAGTHYFIDVTIQSFWPVVYGSTTCQPTAMVRYAANQTQAAQVVLGGYDGYVRQYATSATNDDGSPFTSIVAYGPYRFGGAGYDGQIVHMQADLSNESGVVTWSLYQAMDPENCLENAIAGSPYWTGTWDAGYNSRTYPNAKGAVFTIMLSGVAPWTVEGMRLMTKRKGALR